ncbi:MAG TPA: M48 family metalloprotease [Terriglobales bacterium]|nr:M48 family metalloprotease [Terriglobales bacterium]
MIRALHPSRCLAAFSVLLALALVASAQQNFDPKKGRVTTNPMSGNRYSIEQEIQLGRQAVPEIEKKLPLLPENHPMSKYVNTLGQKLAAQAPGYKFPYTFKVVREKSINAFALPGGPIYVHTGLIEAANEGELAGVMGHEISHVVMRHSTRQATRQMNSQIPLAILGGVLGMGVGGLAGSLGQMGISFTAGTVMMKYSRDAETEADMVGAQIIYDAGYNPEAIVTFFRKLQAEKGQGKGGPQFLNSHPDPGNRAKNISSILSRFPPKQYAQGDSPEFVAAKQALASVKAESPQEVMQQENAAQGTRLLVKNISSTEFTEFRHASYTISYPQDWRIKSNASSASVSLYPEGGMAGDALTYGVMISGFHPKSRTDELHAAVQELRSDIQMSNPSLREYNSAQTFTLQGKNAVKLDWLGTSAVRENGKAMGERVRLVASPGKSGVILYMVFVAPDADFEALSPTFDKIMNSFQVR